MAAKKEVTNASVEAHAEQLEMNANLIRRSIAKDFKEQEEEFVKIPPLYKKYFGRVLPIMIQGVEVAIPVDGKSYKVPKVFAARARIIMHNQDELIQKCENASNVQNNFDGGEPGSLTLF